MIQLNQESGSPPPVKRKRGRPRKDEALTRQESTPITPKPNTVSPDDITGRLVSGVVEGSFDAGYFLNVKVSDSDKQLRGIVFIPEKVTPITAANDVAPHVKMCEREEILVPASNLQAWPQNQQNPQKQTDVIPELQTDVLITDTNQSAPFTKSFPAMQDAAIGSELQFSATAAKNSSACDMKVNDIDNGASSLERNPPQEIARSTPENQALPLMPQSGNDGFSEQCNTVPASMDTMPPEDSGERQSYHGTNSINPLHMLNLRASTLWRINCLPPLITCQRSFSWSSGTRPRAVLTFLN
ncbi:PREDICTED: uncharacterized protein LOC104825122 isoform X2 [Tarenaya hassleriana]|uniref:uncharacterized protein LOC104825122 isoform X2 n=1 Tax=Tarenaya hassleriana TaxID=28532 RepID=UPI00053C9D8A|nr:PREDICTED: uncharacterized protein LOC104825122 isoform X2 [Tarenaya hassleriana]